MANFSGASKRIAKFLLFTGAAVTLGAMSVFQWNLLKQDADEEKFVVDRMHNIGDSSVIQFKDVYKELDDLESKITSNPPQVQAASNPAATPQPEKARDLATFEAQVLHTETSAAPEAHERLAWITFFFFVVGAAFSVFGTFWEFIYLFKENGRASVVKATTTALGTLIKVLDSFYIPIVFGALAIFRMIGRYTIDWIVILLFLIALAPQLLPLLAKYVTKISIGLKGLDVTIKESSVLVGKGPDGGDGGGGGGATSGGGRGGGGSPAAPAAGQLPAQGASAVTPPQTPNTVTTTVTPPPADPVVPPRTVLDVAAPALAFGPQARKVLKTLWFHQNEHFPGDPGRRWCFGVGHNAPDYAGFSLGLLELIRLDFVGIDSNGLVFLNNRGMVYCAGFDLEVRAYTEMYDRFVGLT